MLSHRLLLSLHSQTHTFTAFETRHTNPRSSPCFPHTRASILYLPHYQLYLRNQSSLAPHFRHRLYFVSITFSPSAHPSLTSLYSLKPSLHHDQLPFLILSLHNATPHFTYRLSANVSIPYLAYRNHNTLTFIFDHTRTLNPLPTHTSPLPTNIFPQFLLLTPSLKHLSRPPHSHTTLP